MKQTTILFFTILLVSHINAQQQEFVKKFDYFSESRGNTESGLILTLPYQEMVLLEGKLNSNSGLGPTFNYYGTVVVVDQLDALPNGNKQVILRREDGRDFYGYKPTLKAVLITNTNKTDKLNIN